MQFMPDTQTTVSIRGNAPWRDKVLTVNIDGASAQITQKFYFAGAIAEVFKVNTSVIVDFDEDAVIEKVVDGPPGIQGEWNVCTVMEAFVPTQWKERRTAVRALAKTSIAEYPSRKEVHMAHNNGAMMTVVYMNTDDIYQLFINFNVPGVRQDAGRLWKGVNTGDAGVINEALQAAYDPSAGQAALQAGEAVQQPCVAFDQQALVSAMNVVLQNNNAVMATSISNTITSAMTVVMQTTTAAFGATMNAVLQSNNAGMTAVLQNNNAGMTAALQNNNAVMTALVDKMDDRLKDVGASAAAKLAENKAETDAKMAETDAKLAENKADTDAKMAVIMQSLNKVAKGCAPVAPLLQPVRKYTKYTAESKTKTLKWLLEHSKNPYPTPLEIEILRQETGIDTYKRMSTLVVRMRTNEMVRGENGQWRKRVEPNHASELGNKRAWTQQNISDLM